MPARKDKRKPSPVLPPPGKGIPRQLPELPGAGNSGDRLCWRFTHVDHEGQWSFREVAGAELGEIMECLAKFETMTVSEAFCGSGYPAKDYDVAAIPTAAARERLEAIGLADMTKISVFRLNSEKRLYGFRCGNVFHIVWWDPRHEIWPSKRKHT